MNNDQSIKRGLVTGIISLFILLSITPIVIGNIEQTNMIPSNELINEDYVFNDFDIYLYPEYVAMEKNPDIVYNKKDNFNTKKETEYSNNNCQKSTHESATEKPIQLLDGPMDSAWPMHGHDVRHTGLSPYSTANNVGEEKWWFFNDAFSEGSPVIDNDGVIYFGSWDDHFYALYPNGTLKWKFYTGGNVETSPAIAEDGTIYVGTHFAPGYGTYLYAINSNGTLKWKYQTGSILSSPAIGNDGTIYFGDCDNWYIKALYPNGTLKWVFKAGGHVLSSPAIGDDGTIYCGSHDNNIYALYPNNGTVKWKFNTGNWVHGIPTIGDDGTIYCGSDDMYMYALYPNNGSMKWRCYIGSVWGSPALDKDGNLYVGVWEKKFYLIYPNGTIKWSINLDRRVWGMSAVISDDGTIYFGTCEFEDHDGGHLHVLNPDGTIKYILYHTRMFWASPAIEEDGTVYICTRKDRFDGGGYIMTGYLRALGELDPDAPLKPVIDGPKYIKTHKVYEYSFKATSPLGKDVYLWIEWGDMAITGWIGPYKSGEVVTLSHKWVRYYGPFKIRTKAKDSDNLWGPWSEFMVSKPRDKSLTSPLFLRYLELFPLLERFLTLLL